MYCVGFTDSLTISVPLQAIASLAADFDGDVLNVMLIISQPFYERARIVFNPRNNMYISHIDGKLNKTLIVERDTIINANTFMWLGRDKYSPEQLENLNRLKSKQKQKFNI